MAKTSYLSIPAGLEDKYWSGLQSADRFTIPRIRLKTVFFNRKKIEGLTRRSYLPACSVAWKAMTDQQKQDWKDVDYHTRKHGWRTFVGDKCKRIKFGLSGNATPNQYHQDMVGKIEIQSPAEEIKLIQPHPQHYWISKRVSGKKGMYEPIKITENFSLPLKIALSFKSNLTSTGAGSFVKFYAKVLHLYQGQNLYHDLIINIPLSAAWQRQDITISSLIGQAISYNLYIHFYKVTGSVWFDNLLSEHSGQNWARGMYCRKIQQSFSRGFYQVPRHWAPITLPSGAQYRSVYP